MALHHYSDLKQPCPPTGLKRQVIKLVDKMLAAILSRHSSDELHYFIGENILLRHPTRLRTKNGT